MNGKCNKKIKHNFETTYNFANLGFNIPTSSCINAKEGFGWKYNKSERVYKYNNHPMAV